VNTTTVQVWGGSLAVDKSENGDTYLGQMVGSPEEKLSRSIVLDKNGSFKFHLETANSVVLLV